MGDPLTPKSQIVFAPRGGGKSAQRRMIEDQARDSGTFMCISYDHFDQPAGFKAKDANLAYHLNQVCRLILLSILVHLEENPHTADFLTKQDRNLLKVQVDHFVGSLSAEEFQTAVSTIKTLGDKTKDFLKTYAGPIGIPLEAMKKKWGLDIDLPQSEEPIPDRRDMRFHLSRLDAILRSWGMTPATSWMTRLTRRRSLASRARPSIWCNHSSRTCPPSRYPVSVSNSSFGTR